MILLYYAQLKGATVYGFQAVVLRRAVRDLSHSCKPEQVEFWRNAVSPFRRLGDFCSNAVSSERSRIHQSGKLEPDVPYGSERTRKRYRHPHDVPLYRRYANRENRCPSHRYDGDAGCNDMGDC